MQAGEHDWPEEFRDEDKWVFLTKRQWLIMIVGVLAGGAVVWLFFMLHLNAIIGLAFVVAGLCLIAAAAVAFFPMPDRFYLFGGGERLEKILFRLMKKKGKGSKIIWTANYDNDCGTWGEGAARVRESKARKKMKSGSAEWRGKLPWE